MADSGSPQTTTTVQRPPPEVMPYIVGQPASGVEGRPNYRPAISGLLPEAQAWYESATPTYFPGQTLAGLDPAQSQGIQSGIARAQGGSPLNQAAGGYLQDVIGGRYLGGQSLAPVSEAIWGQVQPRVNSAAGLTGRTGSGAHEGVLSREFTNALAPYAFNQYAQERGLQQQAAGMAPQIAAQDYADINAGIGYGGMLQGQNQAEINAQIARHNFDQSKELDKLNALASIVYGYPGSSQSQKTQMAEPGYAQQTLGAITGLIGAFTGGAGGGSATGAGK